MVEIVAKNGEAILVDEADMEILRQYKWHIAKVGYVRASINGEKIYMHRLLFGLSKGDKRQVDHINHNRLDNRRENLRLCEAAENRRNQRRRSDNTTGFKGVHIYRGTGRFVAQIAANGRRFCLGTYATPELAHEMYCLAADMLHGEFANHGG